MAAPRPSEGARRLGLRFGEPMLRKFERLRLVSNLIRTGTNAGDRRSRRYGSSVEFVDYRNYTPGDELNRVDWNIFARLDKPFIKLREDEQDVNVHLLIDISQSMDWPHGASEGHKLTFAERLAAALGYIALNTGDRLTVTALRADSLRSWGPYRGRGSLPLLFNWLAGLDPGGETDLNEALSDFGRRVRRSGLVILLSDMFSQTGYQEGLRPLLAAGYEVGIIHTLSPDERDPELAGDLRLIDSETDAGQDITFDPAMRDLYLRRLRAWQDDIDAWCRARRIHYACVSTDTPLDRAVLFDLQRAGMVR
jgi:uncharacterized protein (DUF58 family)